MIKMILYPVVLSIALAFSACGVSPKPCQGNEQNLPDCPPKHAVNDEKINAIYKNRTWLAEEDQHIDPVELGRLIQTPANSASVKIVGASFGEALDSLAIKISMIENAQHTVDASYYIFTRDRVGYALLGAMCNAVKRGVDIRIMVDSIGSFHPSHSELKALETCTEDAGFMRNEEGKITTKKARVQVVIFNSLTKLQFNRRSHDKLLIVDGFFADKAMIMTGGRNISLHYYGIYDDGSKDFDTFRDLEVLIKPGKNYTQDNHTVARISELYYGLLFRHRGNKRIRPNLAFDDIFEEDDYHFSAVDEKTTLYDASYISQREKSQKDLAFLKNLPNIKSRLDSMPKYMSEGFNESRVRLSHQLSNLTNDRVTTNVKENLERNPNSILYLLSKAIQKQRDNNTTSGTLRIVSPYLFSGLYKDKDGNVVFDGTKNVLDWLNKHPNMRLEIVTNSVLTGDNVFTQAIIDMNMVPRFLLSPDLQKKWLDADELNFDIAQGDEWRKLMSNPQVFIYQTGKLDSTVLGGSTNYGKLHAKFIVSKNFSFVGTSNFDYRSNLYNNEMGFFIDSKETRNELIQVFEALKKTSYLWGSPEWIEMRKKLIQSNSKKAGNVKKQRRVFKVIRALGLEYLM